MGKCWTTGSHSQSDTQSMNDVKHDVMHRKPAQRIHLCVHLLLTFYNLDLQICSGRVCMCE